MDELTTYDDVNNAWGGVKLPPITTAAAARLFGKLATKFAGRGLAKRRGSWTRRGRRCWAAPKGTDTAKPRANGLPRMVHDASHWAFDRLHPGFKTHSAAHAAVEKGMIECVLAEGWHLPKEAKPAPTLDEKQAKKLEVVRASIKRWETKAKRADTALRKLRRKERRLAA